MLNEHEQLAVIRGLREGSQDAWASLYDGYSVEVWRYVARLLGPRASAVADIVQEVFFEAARSARSFDAGRGTLWSWLVGIAHHRAQAHWRETNRHARWRQMVKSGEIDVLHVDSSIQISARFDAQETTDFVRGVLAELSFENATLLVAKYLDDRSLVEIATQFGGSTDAIKSKLARARREFRSKFEFMTKVAEAPVQRIATEKPSATD